MSRSYEASLEPELIREIPFGESRSESISYPSNLILTRKYSGWSFIPAILLKLFRRCAYLWLLLVCAVDVAEIEVGKQGGGDWATVAVFALVLLIAVAREVIVETQHQATDRLTNSVLCRIWTGQGFDEVRSGSVFCGDLLLVSNSEALVSDVVLLTTEHPDGICYVDSSQTLGSAELTLKRAVNEVHRYTEASTVDRLVTSMPKLRGMIRTTAPSQDFQTFHGSLRLARAPAAVPLSMENFLLRGSRMYASGWVLCCVVGTGMETKVMLNSKTSIDVFIKLQDTMERYACIALGVMILLIVGNIVGFEVTSNDLDGSLIWAVLYYITIIHRLIPAPLLLCMQVSGILQSLIANNFLKSASTIQLNPFTCPSRFGQIDYIVADKSCAFTSGQVLVHTLIYGDKLFSQCHGYRNGAHSCLESMRRPRQHPVIVSDSTCISGELKRKENSSAHTLASYKSKTSVESSQEPPCGFRTLENMIRLGDADELVAMFECIVLCNTIAQLEPLKARNKFEEALITFAGRMGVKLLESYEDRTLLEFSEKRHVYKILASSEYTYSKKRARVLVEQLGVSTGKLLVKGSIETVGPLLNIEDELFEQIRSSEMQLKQSGLVPIVLASKTLPEEQLEAVKEVIWKAQSSIISVNKKIETMFQELERGLHYLGIVCVEDSMPADSEDAVEKLLLSGLKLWVVSNDSETESLASCMRAGYFTDDSYIVPIRDLSDLRDCQKHLISLATEFIYRRPLLSPWGEDASAALNTPKTLRVVPSLERIFSGIEETTHRKNSSRDLLTTPFDPSGLNFMLIIDGVSFETSLWEEETQKLLAALLFTARSVCFFNMLPHQKAKVVRFLRHSFSFHPTVLTFADGLSSIPMLNESDVKVGLQKVAASQSNYLFDAKVSSLNSLSDFLLTTGRNSYRHMRYLVLFILYENQLLVTIFLLYTGLSDFTGISPMSMACVWAVTTVATKPLMLYIGLFHEDVSREEAIEYPQVYLWRSHQIPPKVLIKRLILALFHGAFLFFAAFIDLENSINPSGNTENYLTLSGCFSLMLFLSINAHIIASITEKNLLFWMFFLANCGLYTLEMMIFNYVFEPLVGFMDMTISFPTVLLRFVLGFVVVYVTSLALVVKKHAFSMSFREYILSSSFEITRIAKFSEDITKIWTPSKAWKPPKSNNSFDRKTLSGKFNSLSLEESYQNSILPELLGHIQAGYLITVCVLCAAVVATVVQNDYGVLDYVLTALVTGFCAVVLAVSVCKVYQRYFRLVNLTSVVVLSVAVGAYFVISERNMCEVAICLPLLFFFSFPNNFYQVMICSVANLVVFAVTGVFNVILTADSRSNGVIEWLRSVALVVCVTVSSAISSYFLDSLNREKFRLLTNKENDLEKVDNVLKYLLPEIVRDRVKDGQRFIADVQPNVHIVFCEICRFDQMVKDYEAVEVTAMLNTIYEKFDEICEVCGVTKVETVGKVYMACVGVKERHRVFDHLQLTNISQAQRVLYFAFELIAAIEHIRLADGEPVRIKVGIHSGKVIAGVVGFHKPQFSLVGDTVNTASRMCSTAEEENSIQISSVTYELVKDTYGVQFDHKVKEIKGKGKMDVYVAWKDIGSRSFRGDMEAPDISPQMQQAQRSPALPRGLSIARRNSVFEGSNPGKKQPTDKKRCFPIKILSPKFTPEILILRKPLAITGFSLIFLLTLINTVLDVVQYEENSHPWECVALTTALACEIAVILVLVCVAFTQKWAAWVTLALLALSSASVFGELFYAKRAEMSSLQGILILLVLAAIHFTGLRSLQLLPCILTVTLFTVVTYQTLEYGEDSYFRLACTLGELALFIVYVLYRDARLEKFFELKQNVTAEIEKTDSLLRNLVPMHILEHMKLEQAITDHLESATLLVADIVGFTSWSNDREPSEVIEMLSNLFSEFDQLCLVHNVYKVYTIGDCYIAMGYWDKDGRRDPGRECRNIVRMASDLKKVIDQVNDDYFTDLNMRIGIHTGEIIGAMVGTNIVRYDIYGRDVLIAFKMEANSKPGEINLSAVSRAWLEEVAPGEFEFEPNMTVDIAAIGTKMPCFLTRPSSVHTSYD